MTVLNAKLCWLFYLFVIHNAHLIPLMVPFLSYNQNLHLTPDLNLTRPPLLALHFCIFKTPLNDIFTSSITRTGVKNETARGMQWSRQKKQWHKDGAWPKTRDKLHWVDQKKRGRFRFLKGCLWPLNYRACYLSPQRPVDLLVLVVFERYRWSSIVQYDQIGMR